MSGRAESAMFERAETPLEVADLALEVAEAPFQGVNARSQ